MVKSVCSGENEGELEGFTEIDAEITDGKPKGLVDGISDVLIDGKSVGLMDGTSDGNIDGKSEGLSEGETDG